MKLTLRIVEYRCDRIHSFVLWDWYNIRPILPLAVQWRLARRFVPANMRHYACVRILRYKVMKVVFNDQ